jgi:CPA2 family monovalent cation:H+ antiporter-2
VLAVALGIAVGAASLFGVSVALGAFFAGMVVNGSRLSHEAAKGALPLQDAFSVLFFVAVGMLFDPRIVIDAPLEVAAVVLIVMVGKSLGAFLIVRAFRYPVRTALTISASLAQIGEFSFILSALAVRLGLLPPQGQSLIVAGAMFSITLNPLLFWAAGRAAHWLEARGGQAPAPPVAGLEDALHDHVVVAGYGRVGSAVGESLASCHIAFAAVDEDLDRVEALHREGVAAVFGDATRSDVLARAGVARARMLVIAVSDPYQARAIFDAARALQPNIETVARAHSDVERGYLEGEGIAVALVGARELALAMAHQALERMGAA